MLDKLSKRNRWALFTGVTVTGASFILLKKEVRHKVSKTGYLAVKAPVAVIQTWRKNKKKYLMLAQTLSEEVKGLQSDADLTGEYVYKAYYSGIKVLKDIKDIKLKTKAILSGQKIRLTQPREHQERLGGAVPRMPAQSHS